MRNEVDIHDLAVVKGNNDTDARSKAKHSWSWGQESSQQHAYRCILEICGEVSMLLGLHKHKAGFMQRSCRVFSRSQAEGLRKKNAEQLTSSAVIGVPKIKAMIPT